MSRHFLPLYAAILVPCALNAAEPTHEAWDGLLKKYVSAQARVDYARWLRDDRATLDRYLGTLGEKWPEALGQPQKKAALINAYNAFTVSWILGHYPLESIWRTKKPFTEARHLVNGRNVSLDDIETELRNMGDPRIHAAVVCASRGCPPLRTEAYTPDSLDQQLTDNTRRWLANPEWNEFDPGKNKAKVSKIFDWYEKDFNAGGATMQQFLAKFAPTGPAFPKPGTSIDHKSYHWGLNDTSKVGEGYSWLNFLWDAARNK